MVEPERDLKQAPSQQRKEVQSAAHSLDQVRSGAFGLVERRQHDQLERVHEQRWGLEIEEPRVEP